MVNRDRLLSEFLELVQIDSVSGRERKVCDLLKKRLGSLGLQVVEDDAGGTGALAAGNIVARLAATADGPHLLFCAHMDTVEPGEGIKPVVGEDGVVRSRGETILAADDKAGIAAIMEALRTICEQKIEHGEITVAFTICEETGLLGAKRLAPSVKADFGFVLDSTGPPGGVVVRAPSQDKITATIYGKAAHAGVDPEKGINAIYVAAQAIAAMKLGRIDPETTANIGIISGGKATNIVPDCVYLEGEVRSLANKRRAENTDRICRTIEETARKAKARAEIKVDLLYEGFGFQKEAPVIELVRRAMRRRGIEAVLNQSGGGSDANVLNARGIPTVNLSTGMENVHTTDEQIAVTDIVTTAQIVLELVLCARGEE
ncbi:MAG TPA: M20/M25/M40 family metallo-hydrolase [Desulfotomaculum sp.]|nr:M20/M25/M40 family metallo-hydrolase [Desulfotomaculum sp.]